ncbi:kininogen-1 [Chanos chanos]|uniref:Kininogen-1 n=1 Tax=Chanos chanos TaxID=29144 RepID=A0A6J2WQC7_CHACN|nr:kininogen-1 [Chanos chanos]
MMVGDRFSVLLALAWLCWTGSQAQHKEHINCDDKDVDAAVDLALVKHNEQFTEGRQLALYQILEATKEHNDSGPVISVSFTSRETDCPAGGDKTWRECDYLPDDPKKPRPCHVKTQMTETGQEILLHACSVEPVILPERAPCLGCPEEIDPMSEDLKEPLSYSIAKANAMNNAAHFFVLNNFAYATRQVVAGFRYHLQFELMKSNCSKAEFKEITDECHPHEQTFMNCNSTVDVAPWRHEVPEPHVECEPGPLRKTFMRRRPPGWSPLRTVLHAVPPSTTVTPTTEATTAKSEKESSEECQDKTASVASSDPAQESAQPSTESVSSFNCPSKPWKVFVPAPAPAPALEGPQPDVQVDGFSDADLLGQ